MSIPALAGKTTRQHQGVLDTGVYPRARRVPFGLIMALSWKYKRPADGGNIPGYRGR